MVSTTDEIVNEVAPVEVQQQQTAEIKSISEEEFEKAQKLFQLGKKNLFLNKYDESVNNIGDACKTYASKFGEMDPQCAEVYFFYGRALLELARIENTVLGNALTGVPEENEPINDSRYGNPEEMTADEKNEISEKVIEALCSTEEELKNAEETTKPAEETTTTAEAAKGGEETATPEKVEETTAKPTTEATTEEKAAEETAKPAETMETAPATTTTAAAAAETDDTTTPKPEGEKAAAEEKKEGEDEEDEEDEADDEETGEEETAEGANKEEAEDISNLQSSWEMFELAKLIYTKNFDEDKLFKSKRVAECLLKLGEISIEQEIYEQAITDIAESIRVQEEIESADRDERMLAESYYQLGLARQFSGAMTEAKDAYQRSINIVQLRVDKLKGKLAGLEGQSGEDVETERTRINEEIGELEALTPEMTSKLEECNEPCAETLERIKEAKECFASSEGLKPAAAATTTASGGGDVKDITSLVKSKRKIENGAEEGGPCNGSTKKTKMSEEGESTEEAGEEKMEEKSAEVPCVAETAAEQPAPVEKIEVDENKENVEAKSAEAESKMEEGKVEVAATVETSAEAPVETATTTTAEPIATA